MFVAPSVEELTRVVPLPSSAFQSPMSVTVDVTVTLIVSQSEAVPSETHTSKVWIPAWPSGGRPGEGAAGRDRGPRGHRAGAGWRARR